MTCAIVTSGLLRFFIQTLKIVKSDYDGEGVLAEIKARSVAAKLEFELESGLLSGSGPGPRLKRESEGIGRGSHGECCTIEEFGFHSSFNAYLRWRKFRVRHWRTVEVTSGNVFMES